MQKACHCVDAESSPGLYHLVEEASEDGGGGVWGPGVGDREASHRG